MPAKPENRYCQQYRYGDYDILQEVTSEHQQKIKCIQEDISQYYNIITHKAIVKA